MTDIQVGDIVRVRGNPAIVEGLIDGAIYRNGKSRASIKWLDGPNEGFGDYAQLDTCRLIERPKEEK